MKNTKYFIGIGFVIGFFIGVITGYIHCKQHPEEIINPITPHRKEVIDTLYLTRDSLIYRTQYLDSIKYDTIEKVYKLNDTSTLELFYKLVSE